MERERERERGQEREYNYTVRECVCVCLRERKREEWDGEIYTNESGSEERQDGSRAQSNVLASTKYGVDEAAHEGSIEPILEVELSQWVNGWKKDEKWKLEQRNTILWPIQ